MIWSDDLLGRKADADMIAAFLKAKTSERAKRGNQGYVLNLDASWGFGKTFFLSRFRDELKSQGHLVVYVNGWLDDGSSEPIVSVISAVEQELRPYLKPRSAGKKAWDATKQHAGKIALTIGKGIISRGASRIIGDAAGEIVEIYNSSNTFNSLQVTDEDGNVKDDVGIAADFGSAINSVVDTLMDAKIREHDGRILSISNFRSSINSLISGIEKEGVRLPLIILIDELDRCRPTYALLMLEQIKHLFDIRNVAFVIATDSDQLQHSINAVYGQLFDSRRYLKRFFDRTYRFSEPNTDQLISVLFSQSGIETSIFSVPDDSSPESIFSGAARYFDLSIRDIEQCFDMIHTFSSLWEHKSEIQLLYLLPLIIMEHKSLTDEKAEFLEGKGLLPSGKSGPWHLQRFRKDRFGNSKSQNTDLSNLISQIQSQLKYDLPTITGKDYPENPDYQWVRRVFQTEFSVEHGSSFQTNSPPYSLMNNYPKYIRRLSRLSPNNPSR